jgi:endonuclease/exonuclease/phosphatase family metal-dependent hydrolase
VPILVRTWNLFHGRTVPAGRTSLLEDAVRLVTADEPDVVCLQELPIWSLEYLDEWSGMIAVGAITSRRPIGRELARRLTELHPGRLRSLLTGQANAILVAAGLRVLQTDSIVLNPRSRQERRVAQAARLGLPDGRTFAVGNVHASNDRDERIPDAQLLKAAVFLDAVASPEDMAVLAGDFNLLRGRALDELAGWGFSRPGPGIDHVLVRGGEVGPEQRWPDERRRIRGFLVSDHAPVEVTIA